MPRPSITLTTPIDPGEAHPGATYDKHAIQQFSVNTERGWVDFESNDGWFENNIFMPGVLKTYRFRLHDPDGCSAVFNAVGLDAMNTAILQWLLDQNLVDGTIT